jgi:hypothetical protein
MRWYGVVAIWCLVAIFLGCGGIGLAYEKRLVGNLGLAAVDTQKQMAVVEFSGNGADGLVPATVFSVGWDESHIIARRHPPDGSGQIDKAKTEYYIVAVRGAKVHGPFDEPGYRKQRGVLGVAASLDFTLTFDELK